MDAGHLLVVEDDKQITDFLIQGLTEAGFSVDVARDGREGLSKGIESAYDAIILDLMLPEIDGIQILECLRGRNVNTPILILSARRSLSDRVLGLHKGGDDYLIKPFAFSELLARIHSLIRRTRKGLELTRLEVSDLVIDLLNRQVFRGREEISLKPQEFSLLEYLVRNSGRIVTRKQILLHVWKYQFNPSTNLVDVHICRLRERIEHPERPQLLKTIRGAGYMIGGDDEISS